MILVSPLDLDTSLTPPNTVVFQGLSDTMLAGSSIALGREALQIAHDALSDAGACLRSLPKELPANNDALYAFLEQLVDKIRFMR